MKDASWMSDDWPLTTTFMDLSERKDLIIYQKYDSSLLCNTQSKALEIFKTTVTDLSSLILCIMTVKISALDLK